MRVCIFSSPDGIPSLDRYARELAQGFPPEVEVEVITVPRRPGLMGRIFDKYLKYLRVARRSKADYNIIVSEGFAFLLLALDGRRTLVVCHDVHPLLQRGPSPRGFWRERYQFNLRMLRRAKRVVAVSEHTRDDLLKHCPFLIAEQVVAVHNGVAESWSATPDAASMTAFTRRHGLDGKTYLLHVGNDNWYKNFAGVLRAFASLPHQDLLLVKVGEVGPANQGLIGELGLSGRVLHVPHASAEELIQFYRSARMLVFPSWHEGFGWPPLEAMACGCPVISSNKGSLPEVCGDACLYVEPGDTAGIAAAVERLLADAGLRAELAAKGKAQAARFRWADTAQAMLSLFQDGKGNGRRE